MRPNPLANEDASLISVTSTATSLTDLLDTAAGTANTFRDALNAVDIFVEDGDIRLLYDTNSPTSSKGILLKRGTIANFRKIPVAQMVLISSDATPVSCSVQIGHSDEGESTTFSHVPYILESRAGEDLDNDVQKTEGRFTLIKVAADTLIKTGAGLIRSVTFSQGDAAPTAGSVDFYDATSATGTPFFSHTFTTDLFRPFTVTFDGELTTGLYVDFTTTADVNVTFSYR